MISNSVHAREASWRVRQAGWMQDDSRQAGTEQVIVRQEEDNKPAADMYEEHCRPGGNAGRKKAASGQ